MILKLKLRLSRLISNHHFDLSTSFGRDRNVGEVDSTSGARLNYRIAVTTIATAAAAMTAVASQPMIRRLAAIVKPPIIAVFEVMSIIIAITGTATTPLITALKNSAP
jgi:hypothetical protein